MTSLKTECRKFSPNIFNKIKCQNCFRGKDAHSAEALECNRATRKICLCGYLFVAPDWDFSLLANRNKRWQRRWFVLYDDGELAYSVDEHPDTVPQAVLDMNCVLEVADAENVTGNQFSLAITCPEKVHFIKGMSKDETKKWFEVLSRFPRNTVCGKYKRNATFPCLKSTTLTKAENNTSTPSNRRETVELSNYSKHNGYVNSLNRANRSQSTSIPFDPEDDVYPTKDTNSSFTKISSPLDRPSILEDIEKKKIENSPLISNDSSCLRDSMRDKLNAKADDIRKYLKHETRDLRKPHSRSDVTKMIPSSLDDKLNDSHEWKKVPLEIDDAHCMGKSYHNPVYLLMSDVPSVKKIDSYENFYNGERPRLLRRQSSFGKKSDLQKQISSWTEEQEVNMKSRTIHKSASVPNAVLQDDSNKLLINGHSDSTQEKYLNDSLEKCSLKSNINQVRGDPDGCNLDSLPSSCCTSTNEYIVDQSSENVFLKKGWLVKQDECKWIKYWFVLRNSALTYYTDPIAEDAGILEGVVDLRKVKNVSEVQSNSGHTFCVLMKDYSKLFLSAVGAKIRNNWIRAILQAANLKSLSRENSFNRKKHQDLDIKVPDSPKDKSSPITNSNSEHSISSVDSEKSSGSKTIIEEEDADGLCQTLPPSPPLARTAISRVKERAKTRSNSRTRSPRFKSTEIQETDHNYLADSDDGTTDHSSSSNAPLKEKKVSKENSPKLPEDKISRSERRRSLKLSNVDLLPLPDSRKKVTEIKDKLEDSSWTIWLDISKFCKEVECKLDDIEDKSPKSSPHITPDQRKEIGVLVSSLGRVEERLHKVQNELEKAKVTLLLNNKDGDLGHSVNKTIGCHSLKQEVSRLNGISSQNVLLAQQLNKVREENRRLKSELKTSQSSSDDFELQCISARQISDQTERLHKSQMELMVARVDDLTSKLLVSEKNVRQLRQRVMKLEQRQERRRSSLKGKEALSLSKEYESKLSELEQKIDAVEGVLKNSESGVPSSKEKEELSKESQSLLIRLHNLDKKVKDVSETVTQNTEELVKHEELPKPKIRLQVKLSENAQTQDTSEDWNSLSLSASMTDLSNPEKEEYYENDHMSLTFNDCLENLNYKVASLVSWLKTTLQLLYAQNSMDDFHSAKIDAISNESNEELSKLVCVLDHVMSKIDECSTVSNNVGSTVGRLLYNIILLQEVTNVIFKMSDFEKYKTAMLVQHLNRVMQAINGIEQYIQQKSNPVHVNVQKMSLCNIVACLLFYRSSSTLDLNIVYNVENLFEEVDSRRKKVSSILSDFKEKFIEKFCTTILELSEDCIADKSSSQADHQKSELRPLGQKQFLSHISHIIAQVSQSFISHISKSLNEVYFLCSSLQYGEKWTEYICKLLQQELSLLSSEIKSICIKHLENSFFSSSKCGVLVEYMHCSISELAQIVSIATVVDGTVVLIKDAIYSSDDKHGKLHHQVLCSTDKDELNAFHESLQHRTLSVMANLPMYRFPEAFFSLCNPNELSVAHRSVSSLLCFKQKWKMVAEAERSLHRTQLDHVGEKLNALREEQRRRQEEGCQSCVELRQEVSYLQGELDESRALARSGSLCEKCRNLRLEIQHLVEQHESDIATVEKLEEQDALWKQRVQGIVQEKELQFSEEKWKLEKELQAAQLHLRTMESRYNEEMQLLQNSYEQKLSQRNEIVKEDCIRQRYCSEIDQLKSLCEKGLAAMDASHKKIVDELEQRHRNELDELMAEREKALADEAHATAVALEAVRKAHTDELQRQIQKFKDEFVLKMNKRFETEAFKKCYESDLSNVKHEMMAIAEKYSMKCLENATLQENLEVMTQQLKSTNSQVMELMAKNQQLQARLSSGTLQKQEELL